ncbi:MAG TPA: NADH-quinone oxidoreductase subunit H [Candidatus Ozemobacteraceae bacterium]|nr:NADH-quinone oxidoreductase subunit H [Candidatus Ozemobacteraceae bacterium]
MMATLTQLLIALVAVIVAPVVGALLQGFDRKVNARMQSRIGPPLLQPVYDVLKLLGKEGVILNRTQVLYAWLHLSFLMLATILMVLGQDMVMIILVVAVSTIALILGGMCVRSPYSRIGSHREIMQMLSYEPILVLLVIGIFLTNGSFMARDIALAGKPLLLTLPLVFIAFLFVTAIKLKKSPFDLATSHHGHQELIKGITIEYAGPYLAILEVAHWYETALVFIVLAAFWATNWFIGILLAIIVFVIEILFDNLSARLTYQWMLSSMWSVGLGLAVTNLIWLYWK